MGSLSDDERRRFEALVAPLRQDLPSMPPPRPPRRRRRSGPTIMVLALIAGLLALWFVIPGRSLPYAELAPVPSAPAAGLPDGRQLPAVEVTTEGAHVFHARLPSGDPVTFDPCRSIEWERNPQEMPAGAEALVHEAVGDISARTGLHFSYLGTTDRAALLESRITATEPVLIAWSNEDELEALSGDVLGIGGPITMSGLPGGDRYVSGFVVLDAEQLSELMRVSPERVRLVILHELGHLVGLGHIDDQTELMHESLSRQRGWGPGDLQGLALLGQGSCRP